MHTEKQKFFDDYAKNIDTKPIQMGAEDLEIEDWEDLLLAFRYAQVSLPDVTRLIFEACDLVQKAQQDRIAKAALIRHDLNKLNNPNAAEYEKCFGGDNTTFYCVEPTSITSENNLIK